MRDLVLECVDQLDVADGARRLLDQSGNAFVALAADADRPVDRGGHADRLLVVGRDLGKIIAPDVARARTVAAVHDGDVLARKVDAGIDGLDGRVVPLRDLAEEDIGEDLAGEAEVAAHAGNVVDGDDAAQDGREVRDAEAGRRDLLVGHRAVGGAEEDRTGAELADAAARADGLIVDLHVRVQLVVVAEPLRIDRVGERCPRSVDLHVLRDRRKRQERHREHCEDFLHLFFPLFWTNRRTDPVCRSFVEDGRIPSVRRFICGERTIASVRTSSPEDGRSCPSDFPRKISEDGQACPPCTSA